MEWQESRVYHTKLDSSGRILIPAEARQRNHLSEGDTLVVVENGHGLQVKSLDQAVADAQEYVCRLIPKEVSLVDELISERREEAKRE